MALPVRRLTARSRLPFNEFLCDRCEQRFKVRGVARLCPDCACAAAAAGVFGGEWIGGGSGA